MTISVYPEPDGEMKTLLLEYLLKIYQSWQVSLSASYDDFYLQIWLYENAISLSQVVCAINEQRNFYKNTFPPVENSPDIS